MKHLKLIILTCILTFAVSCGQQKRYVSYKIKQGETIEDVAKKLNVKKKHLLRLNPDVSERPNANTMIIIPNPDTKKQVTETGEVANNNVSKVQGVVLKQTDVNIIKVAKDTTVTNVEIPDIDELKKNFIVHIAKPKETVYGLKRFYNVEIDSIYKLNPGLEENGLKIGQVVKIKAITTEEEKEEASSITAMYEDVINPEVTLKVAYLLPFRANKFDSIQPVDIFEGRGSRLSNMVTDFYMGAEIAIDSLKAQGIQIEAKVFDTGNKGEEVKSIIADDKLKDVDVVIGPFYSDKAQLVARSSKVPVVFPHFSKNQTQFSSSKLVKASPDINTHANFLIEYLKETYNGETIFVVGDGKSASNAQISTIVSGLKKHDSISTIHILKPEKGYIKKERFTKHMKPKKHCWVIMTSNDNVAVADALNSMVVLPEDVTAQVFAVEKNNAYKKIDNNKLARMNLTYVTNTFLDENAEMVKEFKAKYKKRNYTTPSTYAIKGFDVTYDVLMRLASGNSLSDTYKKGASLRVESKFNYDKKLFGSTSNKGLFVVKYNRDLTLTRLK